MTSPSQPLWRLRTFRGLWLANASVNAGHSIAVFAVSVAMITVLGATPFEAGLVAPLSHLGPLIFGLFAGVLVDRWGPRRTMLLTTWGRAAVYVCAVGSYLLGWLSPWQLLGVVLVVSVADVFFMASHTAVLPRLVGRGRIPDAASSLMATDQVISLVGPAAGGQLVRWLPAPALLAVSAVTQVVAAFGLLRLPRDLPATPKADREPMRAAIASGLRFVSGHRLLCALILATATNNFAAGFYQAAESWYLLRELAIGPAVLGALWSASAVGGITGAVVAPRLGRAIGPLRAVLLAGFLMPVNFALIPLSSLWPGYAVVSIGVSFTLFGLCLGVMSVNGSATVIALTPDDLLARVSSSRRMITQGAMVVGGLLGAVALASIGAVPTLWIAVVIAASQGVFLLRVGVPRRGAPRPDELPPDDGAPPPHTRRAY